MNLNLSVIDGPPSLRRLAIGKWVSLALLAAAFSYIWLLPLLRPRGDMLGGYYRLKDILLGIPIGLATLCSIVVLLSPTRYKRPVALRVTTLWLTVVAVIFACDIAYALVGLGAWRANFWLDQAHIPRRYSVADKELGFVRKPGAAWRGFIPGSNRIVEYRTDDNGFRNDPGVRHADIVFIGDSYTEAAQVAQEDTFTRRVAGASGLSVVNLGRGAYGPQQELIVLRRYGLAYQPRVVVWQLFEGNDLNDALLFAGWREDPQRTTTSLKERYFSNSLISTLLSNTRPPGPNFVAKMQYSDGTTRQLSIRYRYEPDQPAKLPVGFAETTRAVEAGYQLCQSQGIQLVIVFVPTMVRVMEPYISFYREEDRARFLPTGNRDDNRDFSGRLAEFCTQLGCPFLDMLPALRQAADADNRSLYIPNDEHLDGGGHEVVARTILAWLESEPKVSGRPKPGS